MDFQVDSSLAGQVNPSLASQVNSSLAGQVNPSLAFQVRPSLDSQVMVIHTCRRFNFAVEFHKVVVESCLMADTSHTLV